MKICVRGGHHYTCRGAVGIIDELDEDRKVKDSVIKYLRAMGHTVIDCTPEDNLSLNANQDLSHGVDKANNNGADLFVSIHFNNCYESYEGAIGSEVCVYKNNAIAQRVVDALGSLGFKNRGQKIRTGLYELRATSMPSIIVETCFVEATEDVRLYREHGCDKVGKVIAEAISNQQAPTEAPKPQPQPQPEPPKNTGNDWIRRLQAECNSQGFSNQVVDGYAGPNTINGCPLVKQGARGNITKLLQEKLNSLGYGTNGIDGIFGGGTTQAIKSFQRDRGLDADGIVGRGTWSKLIYA